jgi:manganese oxidase
VLTLALEVGPSRWHAQGGAVPGSLVDAFAEPGKTPTIPGPLVRVPAGTEIRVRVHNSLGRRITFFLPTSSATDDSIVLAAGASGELSVRADKPGNYVYRATDSTRASTLMRMDGALGGVIVVDTAGAPSTRDRVFVILMVPDSTLRAIGDTANPITSNAGRMSFTINGRSWPNTERIDTRVGDTLHWRVINASPDIHPMHLHGFYYRVDAFTGRAAATDGAPDVGQMVVTERMSLYSAMSMTWVPERAGNWLFHCHFALHLNPPRPDSADPKPADPHNHALTGMVGLVMGLNVAPAPGPSVSLAAEPRARRRIRLVAVRDSEFPDRRPEMRFEIEETGRRAGARMPFSPTLYLARNEPVSIMVVNHLNENTSVHWHGVELESYYDGVAGLSGAPSRLAPIIAPGDSFEARLTPPRSGTFMYHSHADDVVQQTAGLVGALIVQDGPTGPRPDEHEIFLKGSRDHGAPGTSSLDVNGSMNPDTIVLHAGRPARLRFMSLSLATPNATVTLTARRDSTFRNVPDTMVAQWTPAAKDGADLPPSARVPRIARQIIAMGETYDFSYTAVQRGEMRIEIRAAGPRGALLARVPVRVE